MPTYRSYDALDVVAFRYVKAPYGELSNFAPLPVQWGKETAPSSEHIYQAHKFEYQSDEWYKVMGAAGPTEAKRAARRMRMKYSVKEWELQKLDKMRMTLRWKFEQNTDILQQVLVRTAGRPIVELSSTDQYWGAKPNPNGDQYIGINALGRLWMELREKEGLVYPEAQRALPKGVPGKEELRRLDHYAG